jgi:hypothetical protein
MKQLPVSDFRLVNPLVDGTENIFSMTETIVSKSDKIFCAT